MSEAGCILRLSAMSTMVCVSCPMRFHVALCMLALMWALYLALVVWLGWPPEFNKQTMLSMVTMLNGLSIMGCRQNERHLRREWRQKQALRETQNELTSIVGLASGMQ